jgi:uncharacterized protein involved in response to NO
MTHRSLLESAATLPAMSRHPAVLGKGFRPFFLLAALYAVLAVPLWLAIFAGNVGAPPYLGALHWHAHEMVFGYTVAVIAGFLLTAVGNWTGRETVVGFPLALLAVLWLLGRVAIALGAMLPVPLAAVVDVAFLPVLACCCARRLLQAENARNYQFLFVLGALALSNLGVHLGALGVHPNWLRLGNLVAVDLILVLIVLISARVIPMFTRNATRLTSIRSLPALDRLAAAATVLLVAADALALDERIASSIAGLAGLTVLGRSLFWGAQFTRAQPLLWVLHAGHVFVGVGLLLRAGALVSSAIPPSAALHALTAGAIGTLTLGMMTRVGLGHTGRMLAVPGSIAVAFALVIAGAVLRVVAAWATGPAYVKLVTGAGLLWASGFAIYVVVHARLLLSPRVDGRPG